MANPFAPLSTALEPDWSVKDWQERGQFLFPTKCEGTTEVAGPNYKPLWSGMKAAYEHATRRAKALRATHGR